MMDVEEEDEAGVHYSPPETPMSTIPVTPFMAWAEAVIGDEMVEARVVGIRQLADLPDEYEFVVVTCEEGRLCCAARRYIEGDLEQLKG